MNPEHVEIVKQGNEAIGRWQMANHLSNHRKTLDLSEADLRGADLYKTDLSDADLRGADLRGAFLSEANLTGANLTNANLSEAFLPGALLSGASLFGCRLIRAYLVCAELTGAHLYGTARDDWNIKGVKCLYVSWDSARRERSPRDRDLESGEFERLYAQLPTIEYVFENGMTPLDPLVMDRVAQAINEQNPSFNLQIDSINARGLQPTIKFTVQQEEQKAAALEAVTQEYGIINAKLEGANEALSGVIDRLIKHGIGGPVNIGSNSMVAIGGSTINIQEYIGHLEEIEQAIKEAPPETFTETTKQEALDAINGAIRDFGKNKVKEAVEVVGKLATEIGPRLANPTLFQFLKDLPF